MFLGSLLEVVTALEAPASEELFFKTTEVIDEERAVEVIHLMLNTERH
jgi:hypothetical protein